MGLVRRLDGHESGPKPEVLLRLAKQWHLRGFVEDRRPTLETVRAARAWRRFRAGLSAGVIYNPRTLTASQRHSPAEPTSSLPPWRSGPDSITYICYVRRMAWVGALDGLSGL